MRSKIPRGAELVEPLVSQKTFDQVGLWSSLEIPEGTVGKFSVKHDIIEPGEPQVVVSMRNALFCGMPPASTKFVEPSRVHFLKEEGGTIASDTPQEIFTQWLSYRHAHGKVLTAGLGIGLAPTRMAAMKNVDEVVVVEKHIEVVKLVWQHITHESSKLRLHHLDLFSFIRSGMARDFDFMYLDIWSPTGEGAWVEYIVPLRREIRKHSGDVQVECWLEAEMIEQVRQGIRQRFLIMDDPRIAGKDKLSDIETSQMWKWKPYAVFWKAYKHYKNTTLDKLLDLYLTQVGTPMWEDIFDWDGAA